MKFPKALQQAVDVLTLLTKDYNKKTFSQHRGHFKVPEMFQTFYFCQHSLLRIHLIVEFLCATMSGES